MGIFSKLLAGGDGGSVDDGDTPEERQRQAAEAALDRMIAARASQPVPPEPTSPPETRSGDRRSGHERRFEPGQSAEVFNERRLGADRRRTGGEPVSPVAFGRRPARPGQA